MLVEEGEACSENCRLKIFCEIMSNFPREF